MKEYYTRTELERLTGKSTATIFRKKKIITKANFSEQLALVKKNKDGKNLFHKSIINEYIPEYWLKLDEENKYLKNLTLVLKDNHSFSYRLYQLKWEFFCTIAYKYSKTPNEAYESISQLYDFLISKYQTDIKLFFTSEPFTNRTGYHNHFVLDVKKTIYLDMIKEDIISFFNTDRVDIQPYDENKAGIFYIAKNGLKEINWDIFGNNLTAEK